MFYIKRNSAIYASMYYFANDHNHYSFYSIFIELKEVISNRYYDLMFHTITINTFRSSLKLKNILKKYLPSNNLFRSDAIREGRGFRFSINVI